MKEVELTGTRNLLDGRGNLHYLNYSLTLYFGEFSIHK